MPLVAEINKDWGINPFSINCLHSVVKTLSTAVIQLLLSWVADLSTPFITWASGSLALARAAPVLSIATALTFEVAISMPIKTDLLIMS